MFYRIICDYKQNKTNVNYGHLISDKEDSTQLARNFRATSI